MGRQRYAAIKSRRARRLTFLIMESTKNRNDAYVSILEKLPQKKQLIFQLVKENSPCTAWEISEKYMLPINEVVGRISDLKNDFLLVESGSKIN